VRFITQHEESFMIRYCKTGLLIGFGMLSLAAGSASAWSTSQSAAAVSHCATLPLSERGICKQEAKSSNTAYAATEAAAQQRPMDRVDRARYDEALAACKRLPISEYNTCVDEARLHAALRMPAGPTSPRVQAENQRYLGDLKQCSRLPVSERTTCASISGTSPALEQHG
jgi:hypothetical protein